MKKRIFLFVSFILVLSIVLTACGAEEPEEVGEVDCTAETEAETQGGYQIPAPIEGCYNVAFVYVGPHDDGGWSQAHDVGRLGVEQILDDVHTAYVENVAEGADSEQVTRSLARK